MPGVDDREWQSVVRDTSHPQHEKFVEHAFSTIGRGPLADFDPDHDFLSSSKFNSGVFASRRLADKLSIPIFPLSPVLICRNGGDAIAVSPEDVARGTCQFHVVHWTGPRPSPSFFSIMPLFRIQALLETFVGRRRGEYFADGYEKLSERVAYSLWRQYYEQLFGPMALKDRLLWSWRDFTRIGRLFRRSLKFIVRSLRRD